MAEWWRPWVTPAVVVAATGVMFAYMTDRFSSVDRRFGTLASEMSGQRERTDRVIESIGDVRADVSAVHSELTSVRRRVDGIGDRLEVTEAPSGVSPALATFEDALEFLREEGFELYDAQDLVGARNVSAVQQGVIDGQIYIS